MNRYQLSRALFGVRYSTRGKTLAELASVSPILGIWQRLAEWIFGVKCATCSVRLNDAYWIMQYPRGGKFENLIRMICINRRRCVECAMAEERLEREEEADDGHVP